MEKILLGMGSFQKTVTVIMMLYKDTKAIICSPNSDTDFFNIVSGILQGSTLATYLFIICVDYIPGTSIDLMKKKWFYIKKKRSKQYLAEIMTDTDNADDLAQHTNSHCCTVSSN